MEIIQVPDIKIAKNGQFHSLQNAGIADKGTQQSFSGSSGIFKDGKLYTIGEIEIVRMTTLSQTPSFFAGGEGDITVDWGDGTKDVNVFNHTYSDNTTHEIRLFGKVSAVKILSCRNGQFTTLDISHATELSSLDCSNNLLTSLDLSNSTKYTYISCSNNQLTSLDVSHHPKLAILYCGQNQLTSLDVSQNVELSQFIFSDNQLTSIDVSQNTKLTYLSAGENLLTSINISNNLELTHLYCDHNRLTSLDVSHNTKLVELSCSNNQLVSLDVLYNQKLNNLTCLLNPLITQESDLVNLTNSLPQREVNDKGILGISNSTSALWIQEICDAKNWTII